MRTPRSWKRESRLLLIVDQLDGEDQGVEASDVFALDFLLQHPSLINSFTRRADSGWPHEAVPTAVETESSEETLLRWKRSVGASVLSPMLGRLIARGLLSRSQQGELLLSGRGQTVANRLREGASDTEQARIPLLAAQLRDNLPASRSWLAEALAEAGS